MANPIKQTHGQTVMSSVEAVIDAKLADVFDFVVAADVLPRVLTGYGLIPAVVRASDYTAPWDVPGATRTVHLKGGDTAREEVTDWVRPSYFAYRTSHFTFALKYLATEARGQWWFEERDGKTHVRWTYTFTAKGPIRVLVLNLFATTQWAGLMRVCIQNTMNEMSVDRTAEGSPAHVTEMKSALA